MMSNVKNFVDEKTAKRIIDAITTLDFHGVLKLADDSGVPVSRLRDIIDRTERITQLDKGKLITHLMNLMDIREEEKPDEEAEGQNFTSLKEFQQRKIK